MMDSPKRRRDEHSSPGEVTALLAAWSAGDREALAELIPLVYGDLRRRAEGLLRKERSGHTLQPTALVNEAYSEKQVFVLGGFTRTVYTTI